MSRQPSYLSYDLVLSRHASTVKRQKWPQQSLNHNIYRIKLTHIFIQGFISQWFKLFLHLFCIHNRVFGRYSTFVIAQSSPFQPRISGWLLLLPISVFILLIFLIENLQVSLLLSTLGPVVQSTVSLTSSLRVILLTVLVDSIYNILIFFAEKMWVAFAVFALQKLLTFFQQKISAYLHITRCKF